MTDPLLEEIERLIPDPGTIYLPESVAENIAQLIRAEKVKELEGILSDAKSIPLRDVKIWQLIEGRLSQLRGKEPTDE